jgi:hypothetical protein
MWIRKPSLAGAPHSLLGGAVGADIHVSFLSSVFSTRIISIDPHILCRQITSPRNRLASTKPQIHSDLDISSTHIHDCTINDPAAINDSHAGDRK